MQAPEFTFITRSQLISFSKCANLLRDNRSHRKPAESLYGFENAKIREMAKSYFPPGLTIPKNLNVWTSLEETRSAMSKFEVIHKPVFLYEDLIASPDVLVANGNGSFTAWEIVPSINLKKDLQLGMGLILYTIQKLCLPIEHYKVLRIDPDYLHKEDLNLREFFEEVNFTRKAQSALEEVETLISELRAWKAGKTHSFPQRFCPNFKSCPKPEECFSDLGTGNIFTLRESPKTAMELYRKGILNLKDIPEDLELTHAQKIQIQTDKTGLVHIETERIVEFLRLIRYPTYYLDFETINPQIPIYPYSRPFQHIPFLFSLHILDSPDSELRHLTYIQEDKSDPRPQILQILSESIGGEGTILCFNDFFEKRCISESVEVYSEFQAWFEGIRNNFLDLAIPFKKFNYYHPRQNGSAALKEILPVLTQFSHSELSIPNGHLANLTYLRFLQNPDAHNRLEENTLNDLKEYCRMDTYALYLIQKELQKKVGSSQ